MNKIIALNVALSFAAFGWWSFNAGKRAVQADWYAERVESARLVRQQQDANRKTARNVEIQYVDREVIQTKYLTITQKEIRNETQNLASCRLDDGDISMFNKAARCASGDRSAACDIDK